MISKIQLKLFANLIQVSSAEKKQCIEIQPETTVRDIINKIDINPDEVKLIFINGVIKQIDSKLYDGDRVGLFPPVGGG